MLARIDANPLLDGVTFSGGEPFCQASVLGELGAQLRQRGLNIITYTGFTYEKLLEDANQENGYRALLEVTDYLVDGRFEQDKKAMSCISRAAPTNGSLMYRKVWNPAARLCWNRFNCTVIGAFAQSPALAMGRKICYNGGAYIAPFCTLCKRRNGW